METIRYVLSVTWKELQYISKDRASLAVLFLLPLLVGSLVAGPNIMFNRQSEGGGIVLDVALVSHDSGQFGLEVARALESIKELRIVRVDSVAEAEAKVASGDATAAVVIPAGFTEGINAYQPVKVDVIVDPAEPESSSIVAGIMNQVVAEATIWGEVQYGIRNILAGSGLLEDASAEQRRAIEAQNLGVVMTRLNEIRRNPLISLVTEDPEGVRFGGNWVVGYTAYVFPGLTVMFIFFIVGMAAASVLTERETGVLRRLAAAPIPRAAVVGGKMLAYMLLACAQVVLLFTVASAIFEMPLGRSPAALPLLTVVTGFVSTALAMAIAGFAKSAKQADNLGTVLGFVLGGLAGAIPLGPQGMFFRSEGLMGTLARLTPQGNAVSAFYSVMAEDAALTHVLPEIGILLVMGTVLMAIGVSRFKLTS